MAGDVVRGAVVADGPVVAGRPGSGAVVTVEEQEIARDSRIALARQRAKAGLTEHGTALLGDLYVRTNADFRSATGEALAATRAIEDDEHYHLCENLRRHLTGDLAAAVQHNFRETAAHVASTIASFTPSRPLPPPRRQIVEVRKLTPGERISGQAVLAYEGVVEDAR